ncbi:hypothetical protein O181_018499 [Austropuccinia psidii MF-1]|uniref:Uncharacterized protein n=1 Tax=Austropuccinia psidii MF-1 TaxID=1389203 RepID=A0A9Q3C5E5_9BASI|nr:hypothetical protein [Austropuccinia psidii MF-1]
MLATFIQSDQYLTSLINHLKEIVYRMRVGNSTPQTNVIIKLKETCAPKTPAMKKKVKNCRSEPPPSTSHSKHKNHRNSPSLSAKELSINNLRDEIHLRFRHQVFLLICQQLK